MKERVESKLIWFGVFIARLQALAVIQREDNDCGKVPFSLFPSSWSAVCIFGRPCRDIE